jgi:squalene-associated FAD-dependent desaturase
MTNRVHVVGAGLAGLQAALALSKAGRPVTLYESSPVAGGRCRSYFDRSLDCRIDNGNHLLLSGNKAAAAYLDSIGTRDSLAGPAKAHFPFFDIQTGQRWTIRLNQGRIPWWIFRRTSRVPGTRLADYARLRNMLHPPANATLAAVTGTGPLIRRLIAPLAIASLNTQTDQASAALFAAVISESLMQGGRNCIPAFPKTGLSESFIDPAINILRAQGSNILFNRRISALHIEADRVASLGTPDGPIPIRPLEQVILAVPPWIAADLLPNLTAPNEYEAILNIHFRHSAPATPAGFIGLIGGTAEWVFIKPDIVSVTISAANRLADITPESLVATIWPEVSAACRIAAPTLPPWRVVRERRATFAATPAQQLRRPGPRTPLVNLALAGDWTATGLPATIEGAIRSGRTAADMLLKIC